MEKEPIDKPEYDSEAVHERAIQNINDTQTAVKDERKQCLEDRRFYSIAGAQWEDDLQEYFENRPKIEFNKVHLSVIRIINEYRNNRITVDFQSKDGSENELLANTCDGLYRSDEQDSNADEAYDNAFEEAVGGGFGAYRLRADFEDEYDEENEFQRIAIEPIYDADSSVFFDLNAKKQDKSDAKFAYILTSMTKKEYERIYGDIPASMPKTINDTEFDWSTNDVIYLAEYYECEIKSKTLKYYESLTGEKVIHSDEDFEKDEGLEEELRAKGFQFQRQRKIKTKKVHKYLMNGSEIIEDYGYIAGTEIPIVPVYGKRWFIDNVERCMGHVRLSKDAQRLHNLQVSRLAETAALSPIEKPIFTTEQIAGHEVSWSKENITNNPYALINSITDMNGQEMTTGPIGYTKPPQIAPALAGLLDFTNQTMKELQGNDQALEQVNMNLSGEAIGKLQDRLDMQTYIYVSNMAKAIKRGGEIWLAMAKDVYVEENRKMKVVAKDNSIDAVELSIPFKNEDSETEFRNDLKKAKFNLAVEVGPATASKKQATVNNLLKAAQAITDPQLLQVISHLILMNMEGEGVTDASSYARKQLVRQGVINPTEQEKEELAAEAQAAQNQPLSEEEEYLKSEAIKNIATAQNTQAKTEETIAKTEQTRVETAETLVNIEQSQRQEVINMAKDLDEIVEGQRGAEVVEN